MKSQRGFVSAAVLVAIVLGLIVVAGGAYFVIHQQSSSQTVLQNLQEQQTSDVKNPTLTKSPEASKNAPTMVGTVSKIDNNFWKDEAYIYYVKISPDPKSQYADGVTIATTTLEKANPKTFTRISEPQVITGLEWNDTLTYYRDGGNVFVHLKHGEIGIGELKSVYIIPNADPASFTILNYLYAKDANHVYSPSNKKHSDPLLPTIVQSADAATFALLKTFGTFVSEVEKKNNPYYASMGYVYGKDKNHLFINEKVLTDIDSATFIELDKFFAKDKNHVVSPVATAADNPGLASADPSTFITLGVGYGKDKSAVYHYNYGKVEGADINTFTVLTTEPKFEPDHTPDAKDKNHFYQVGTIFQQ